MKFERSDKFRTIAVYSVMVALFTVLCVLVGLNVGRIGDAFKTFVSVSKPLIYAFTFAFMMLPLSRLCHRRLFAFTERRKPHPKLRTALSVTTTYLIVLAFLTLFLLIFIPQAVAGYNDLYSKLGSYIKLAQAFLDDLASRSVFFAEQYQKVADSLGELIGNIYELSMRLTPRILAFASAFVTETKNILLGFLFSVYFLISYDKLTAQTRKFARAVLPDRAYDGFIRVGKLCSATFGDFIIGKTLDAILMGLSCVTLMTLLQLPYAPLVSLILGILSFIPYIGILIGALPGLFIIFISEPSKTVWFILIVVLLQLLDSNLIEPRVLSERNGLSSMWVLIAVLVMSGLLGVTGLFIGVPLFNVIYILFKDLAERKLRGRGMPEDTQSYMGEKIPEPAPAGGETPETSVKSEETVNSEQLQ